MKNLSNDALALLQYIYKFRDGAFKGEFTVSLFCQRKALGYTSVDEVKPLLEELEGVKALKQVRSPFRAPRYKINEKVADKYIEEAEDAQYAQEYRDALEEEIKKYKKFVVTTAVMGKEAYKPFLDSIRNYAERNNAMLLVLPCEDVASRGKKANPIELSSDLKDFKVVFKDTYLNKNLCLCAIKMSAKQINPLSGLDRLTTARQASIIVASPKIFLKYIPNMHYDIPPALMTTGAVTVNDYDNDRYMSKRTSALAENDHAYGAVIVEVESDDIFHFRHVQASEEGTLTDMGIEYLPDGDIREMKDTVMVMGDSHTGYHDKELHDKTMAVCRDLNVSKIVLHDVFNGTSITHHDIGKSITRATKAQEGKLGLELECVAVKNYIENIEKHGMEVFIVRSNHDSSLDKYLERGGYMSDPMNLKFSLKLAAVAIDGINPLKYAIESLLGYKRNDVHWLELDRSCKFYGVEIALHGSEGAAGARGSARTFNNGIGNCVTAHTHSASIMRNTYTVGTVGLMDMKYNVGLSAWTRTCCLIYNNGTKQLINFIPNKSGDYTCNLEIKL
jgi:hypothetical protein